MWRRLGAGCLATAGGGLVGLSLPPLSLWPLAIVGTAVVFNLLAGRTARQRVAVGFCFGIGQFFVGLAWALQFNSAGYVVLSLLEAAFFGLACGLVPARRGHLAGCAGAFVLAEWAREAWPFGGLPLGGIALSQLPGPLAGTARLGGSLLVAGVTFLAGAVLAEAATALAGYGAHRRGGPQHRARHARRGDPGPPVRAWPSAVAGAVAVVAIAIAGTYAPDGAGATSGLIGVAVIQGGGQRGLDQLQVAPVRVLHAALRETARLRRKTALVLWPEDVVASPGPFFGSPYERLLARLARSRHTTLLAGVTEPVGSTRFRNEIVAFGPEGNVEAVFEKVHRVPFGEYVPWRGLFKHLANLSDVPRDAIAGHGSGMIATSAGRFAVLVSYEVFFSARGRSGVRAGGTIIVVPTNTSSYSSDQEPSQEIAASRLQAIEEGRYVLQAAPTGYSAVIDNTGRVLKVSSLASPAILTARVPKLEESTVYEIYGGTPVLAAAIVMVLGGWAAGLGGWAAGLGARRRRRDSGLT
ncbi:MAG: apolipoprotein N-acyltransferase [Acidimicrobiales bacterium]